MNAHTETTSHNATPISPDVALSGVPQAGGAKRRISQPAVVAAVLAFDTATLLLSGAVTGGFWRPETNMHWLVLISAIVAVTITTISGLNKNWAYTIPALTGMTRQIALTGIWIFLALATVIVTGFLLGMLSGGLKPWLAYWFASAWGTLAISRIALASWLKMQARAGNLARRTVIAGGGDAAASLIDQLQKSGKSEIQILGLFDDRGIDRSPDNVSGYAKLGSFDALAEFCRSAGIDLIIVALPPAAEDRILHLLKKLWVLPIDIRISAHGSKLKLRERAYSRIGSVPFLPVFDKPMSDWGTAMKAIEDRLISGLALIALSPLFAIVAIAIKLNSRGPVFFQQIRYGFNNEPIHVLKFRSMYTDQCDARATKLVTKDDPRVTSVGRFIRKTSIDELPQLINVLRGDLSLVGPRPHALQAKAADQVYDEAVDGYFARHKMKPGITGWAQINGWRGETDTLEKIEQRVAHDLHYIEHWSLFLDLYILIKTPLSLLDTKNAY